ncbi:unnamed protein product [Urochloa humidicola]
MVHLTRFKSHQGKEIVIEEETNGTAHGIGEGANQDGGGEGDAQLGSPSDYLNFDFDDLEEPVQPRSEVTESSVKSKGKRGRSKMPQGRTVIRAVDASGEPVEPITVQGPYKTAIGNIVRDNVPIKYRSWNGKDDPTWTVPDETKEICWGKVLDLFTFPGAKAQEAAKKKALQVMAARFKQFRCQLNKLVQQGREPDWNDYPTQRPYWREFVEYKLSKEAQELSAKNTANARKNPNPHNIGSR